MTDHLAVRPEPPRIEALHVKNYRVLRDLKMSHLTPLTVLLGANGSGKSTVFDVFAFLAECFTVGLRRAWDKRNRFRQLRSRGASGPISIELEYRETPKGAKLTYRLAIDERDGSPVVSQERLRWTSGKRGRPPWMLDYTFGQGYVISDDDQTRKEYEDLASPDLLAVSTLGQLTRHPRVNALRRFISGWYLSYLSADSTRSTPEAGPQEHLSQSGDNLPNVIQYLGEQHSNRLEQIFAVMADRIPQLERVEAELLADGRLLLQIRDEPFSEPILAKYASDGTMKMLAYLTFLYDPDPAPLIGIEEPENQLHPRLLPQLAEECRLAAGRSQLLVTTHSPNFVDALKPDELWVLSRGGDGFTRAQRASEMPEVLAFVQEGGQLGALWMEGFFDLRPLGHSVRLRW
ncbi:MAG: AAA family ATPase [Egibacteraceae bacterium]